MAVATSSNNELKSDIYIIPHTHPTLHILTQAEGGVHRLVPAANLKSCMVLFFKND